MQNCLFMHYIFIVDYCKFVTLQNMNGKCYENNNVCVVMKIYFEVIYMTE